MEKANIKRGMAEELFQIFVQICLMKLFEADFEVWESGIVANKGKRVVGIV